MPPEDRQLDQALELHRQGRLQDAAAIYQEVLALKPNDGDVLYLFGCLLQQTGNHPEALRLFSQAVQIAPEQAEYHYARGLSLAATQELQAAIASFGRAVDLSPDHVPALTGLGRVLRSSDRTSYAGFEFLARALKIKREDPALARDVGDALLDLGQPGRAAEIYRHAISLDPESAQAWYGLGCADNLLQDYVAAREHFGRALELQPDWLEARHNRGRALYELGMVVAAYEDFQRCSLMNVEGSEQSRAMLAVIAPGVPALDHAGVLHVRKAWAERDLKGAAEKRTNIVRRDRRRVGYVSSFFHRDNWMKPVWGLINQHDRRQFEIHLFSDCAASQIQNGYRAHSEDKFFDTSQLSNGEILALIEQSEIDVLIDLNGYSNMRRLPLFARRAAPVTIEWFNMYATSGISRVDYLIGDHQVVLPEEEPHYSERILRVAGSYLTFDVNYPVPEVGLRSEREPVFVFGAFASQYKITDPVIESWSGILHGAPETRLLIKNQQMGMKSGQEDLLGRFAGYAIGPERLLLEGPENHYDFLRAYERVDLALDTFPYNGGTTTTEALWQGVPVVTFFGDRWASRTSASLLRAAALDSFVAPNLESYVRIAIEYARREGRVALADLRHGMRSRLKQSAVCDTASFARQMEQHYLDCCDKAGSQASPGR